MKKKENSSSDVERKTSELLFFAMKVPDSDDMAHACMQDHIGIVRARRNEEEGR